MTQGIASIWTGLGMGLGGPFGGYIADRFVGLVCPPPVVDHSHAGGAGAFRSYSNSLSSSSR